MIGWPKAARLLRPGGWLALLTTGERYDDPLGAGLRELWLRRSSGRRRAWAAGAKPAWAETITQSEMFTDAVEICRSDRVRLPAEVVLGVECTRATFLSYSESNQAAFVADLRQLLGSADEVNVTQDALLAMARVQHGQPLL